MSSTVGSGAAAAAARTGERREKEERVNGGYRRRWSVRIDAEKGGGKGVRYTAHTRFLYHHFHAEQWVDT